MTLSEEHIAKIRSIARKRARKFRSKTDWQALAEDCEIGGWIGYLEQKEKGSPEWVCWSEANYAMTDVIVNWLYGVRAYTKRSMLSKERIPFSGVNLRLHPSPDPGPESVVVARDLAKKIHGRLGFPRNGSTLKRMFTDAVLDGRLQLRRFERDRGETESVRIKRGRRVRQIKHIAQSVLKEVA